ncbi:unnamed protein product [Boreogadus saida]
MPSLPQHCFISSSAPPLRPPPPRHDAVCPRGLGDMGQYVPKAFVSLCLLFWVLHNGSQLVRIKNKSN